jgi:hypothetical protein
LDGNKRNNHVENLCWGTYSENSQDSYRLGALPKGEDHHFAKLNRKKVMDILLAYHRDGISAIYLAEKYGLNRRHVHDIVAGRRCWKDTWKLFKTSFERVDPFLI